MRDVVRAERRCTVARFKREIMTNWSNLIVFIRSMTLENAGTWEPTAEERALFD